MTCLNQHTHNVTSDSYDESKSVSSFQTNSGKPFSYFTYGAACSVVEIDCLTGDHDVIRTDIVMDVGESLNPAIDVGQVQPELDLTIYKIITGILQ